MQVVLLEKIERLGKMGDVVNVKPGYARNFLLPKKKALRATEGNIAYFEKERAVLEAQSKDLAVKAEGMKKMIEGQSFIIIRQASESGSLYGSVTSRDIAEVVQEKISNVTRHHVVLDMPLKIAGIHYITLKLHPEVMASIVISIAPSEEEAKSQLLNKDKLREASEKEGRKSSSKDSTKEMVDELAETSEEAIASEE